MSALSASDRSKLVAVLARLGSDFDGERAAAGLLASRFLRQRGLVWDDLIDVQSIAAPSTQRGISLWRADLALAERHISFCRPWEQQFLRSVAQRQSLSSKQRLVLTEIADALRARGKS